MSQRSSEEKSLPASQKKLRDARRKGQVDNSTDMVTAMVMLAATLYLGYAAAQLVASLVGLFQLAAEAWQQPFALLWPRIQAKAGETLVELLLPLTAVTIVVSLLTNLAIIRGLVFSTEPLKPQFERINPVEGLKRIFSLRSLIELLKSLFKMIALGSAMLVIFRFALQMLMDIPQCGFDCIADGFLALLKPLVITALLAFMIVGGLDMLLQRWLFRRDQRMTKSEQKRERKDSEGDPLLKRERQRRRRDMHATGARQGIEHTSLLIGAPGDWMVGVRYVRGETPVPIVTCRAGPERSAELYADARGHHLPLLGQPALAARVAKRAGNGEPIPEGTFQAVADLLVEAKLV